MANRRELTAEEMADTHRLKQVWKTAAPTLGLTQQKASQEFGFANQSAISQYLNGRIPLNMVMASRFANLLKVPLGAISPSHASNASTVSPLLNSIKKAFKASSNCELCRANSSMKPIVGNADYLLVDKSQTKPAQGVFLVGEGDGIKALRITLHRGSYKVAGLVPKTQVTLPIEAIQAMKIFGKVAAVLSAVQEEV